VKTYHAFVVASDWPFAVALASRQTTVRRVDGEAAGAMNLQGQTNRLADPWSQAFKAGFLPIDGSPLGVANRVNDWLWLSPHLV
jgi:hypothetical protein